MKSEHDSDVSRIDGGWADLYYEVITVSDFRPGTASSNLTRPKPLSSPIIKGSTVRHHRSLVQADFGQLNIEVKCSTARQASHTSKAVLTKCVQTTSRQEIVNDYKPPAFGTDIFGNLRQSVIYCSSKHERASSQSLSIGVSPKARFRSSHTARVSFYSAPEEVQAVHKPNPLKVHKILPTSLGVSLLKRKKAWGLSYNRIKRSREDQKGFVVEACESKSIGGVLEPKYSIIKPKTASPKAIMRTKRLDRAHGAGRNSLLSIIAL